MRKKHPGAKRRRIAIPQIVEKIARELNLTVHRPAWDWLNYCFRLRDGKRTAAVVVLPKNYLYEHHANLTDLIRADILEAITNERESTRENEFAGPLVLELYEWMDDRGGDPGNEEWHPYSPWRHRRHNGPP